MWMNNHRFFVIVTIITPIMTPENVAAIATAKDIQAIAMHVMHHLVVLRIARPWFQVAVHTAASNQPYRLAAEIASRVHSEGYK
jgi:hypothetical protein